MRIDFLEIENIRNIKRMKISLHSPLVVISGKNAQGKTSILEAIHFLSIGKSLRRGPEKNIISKKAARGRVKGKFYSNTDESLDIEFILGEHKTPKLNGKRAKLSDVVGEANSVLFTADDLAIIESPQKRRRFINILLSQIDKSYLLSLIEYQHVLKRRNKLLFLIKSNKAKEAELSFWDSKIEELSESIVSSRKSVIDKINLVLNASSFFKTKKFKIVYDPSLKNKEEAKKELIRRRERDIVLGHTTAGAHRDNINFYIDDLNLNYHGSRGEKRGAVVELKRAEIKLLGEKNNEMPILLLDDVFSELDSENKKIIIDAIDKEQTIIATTDEKELGRILEKAKIYKINEGVIEGN